MLYCQPLKTTIKFDPQTNLRLSMQHSPFKKLPEEMIVLIFTRLNNLDDKKSFRGTSRYFYKITETPLVELLAKQLNIPIVLHTKLDEFCPVSKLYLQVRDFLKHYFVVLRTPLTVISSSHDIGVGEIRYHTRHLEKSEEDYAKILWHLLQHRNSKHPFVKRYLQLFSYEFQDPLTKRLVIALLYLPNDTWTNSFQKKDLKLMSAWKDETGHLYLCDRAEIPEKVKREDNLWILLPCEEG